MMRERFQSTSVIADGRIQLRRARGFDMGSFNPRPSLLTDESQLQRRRL